jgi:hypothetical protein
VSDQPRDLVLERVNRLTVAVADLTESHVVKGRQLIGMIQRLEDQLDRMEARMEAQMSAMSKSARALASEQAVLGNRVDEAFSRALRTHLRLDQIEDRN